MGAGREEQQELGQQKSPWWELEVRQQGSSCCPSDHSVRWPPLSPSWTSTSPGIGPLIPRPSKAICPKSPQAMSRFFWNQQYSARAKDDPANFSYTIPRCLCLTVVWLALFCHSLSTYFLCTILETSLDKLPISKPLN